MRNLKEGSCKYCRGDWLREILRLNFSTVILIVNHNCN